MIYDMLVIGGGPGGYTAALYAAREGLSVLVLEKLSAGGQMALTNQVDNYPGFPEGIDGFELAELMQQQAEKFGAKTELAEVYSLALDKDVKEVSTSEGVFYGRTVAIATGANPRKLGVPGEEQRNVHYCAACDGMAYKGKTVLVIGGGDSAVAEALTLSRIAKQVYLVHRRKELRAAKVYEKPLQETDNISFVWDSAVTEITRSGAKIRNLQSNEDSLLQGDGVFISIGREPATALVKGQLELDEAGYLLAGDSTQTSLPGVYAVGDVRTKRLRQIVTAVADGAMAAHSAGEYLSRRGG